MSTPNDTGCTRCRDYDEIKDELEREKQRAQDEQKNALNDCETKRSKLQKQLITVGAAAVVGGTILGKEFVDEVASYIESFNKVTNIAPNIVGSAMPIGDSSTKDQPDEPDEKDEKEDERRTPSASPAVVAFSPYTNVNPYPIFTMDDDPMKSPIEEMVDQVLNPSPIPMGDLLASFSLDIPQEMPWQMNLPLYEFSETPSFVGESASVIPAPGTLFVFGFMLGRRRRR